MISRLPRWVEYGAFLLALLAGCVNAVGLLGFQHQAITNLSGTVTQLGNSLLTDVDSTIHLLFIVFSFLIGSVGIDGLIIENTGKYIRRASAWYQIKRQPNV